MTHAHTTQTTAAAQALARELFERFRAHSQEAEQLALQLIASGEARLRLSMVLAGGNPDIELLLEPTDGDGLPVEIATTCPVEASAEGIAERFWFFGRLGHWQPKH
jgi:hypothetical protein